MTDSNVVYLYKDHKGVLNKVEDIPTPGSMDWVRDISRTFIRIGLVDESMVELVIANIPEARLDEFICRMLGNLLDLFSADKREYEERERERFNSIPLPEDDERFFINLIYDLGRILYLEPSFINHHVSKLSKGQICTFYVANVKSFAKIIEPETEDPQP